MPGFPGREMRVIDVIWIEGHGIWIDAVPINPEPGDTCWHSTYRIGSDGRPLAA